MPRGDSRSFPLQVPTSSYSVGTKVFFALKSVPDNVLDDSSAVLKKQFGDSNITSNTGGTVTYALALTPSDTNLITPGVYRAEIEIVSADSLTVISYPDPSVAIWNFEISADINRRVS